MDVWNMTPDRPFSFVTDGKSDNLIGCHVKEQDRKSKSMGLLQVPMDYQCRTYQTNPIPAIGVESDTKRECDGRNSHGGSFLTINFWSHFQVIVELNYFFWYIWGIVYNLSLFGTFYQNSALTSIWLNSTGNENVTDGRQTWRTEPSDLLIFNREVINKNVQHFKNPSRNSKTIPLITRNT